MEERKHLTDFQQFRWLIIRERNNTKKTKTKTQRKGKWTAFWDLERIIQEKKGNIEMTFNPLDDWLTGNWVKEKKTLKRENYLTLDTQKQLYRKMSEKERRWSTKLNFNPLELWLYRRGSKRKRTQKRGN